MLVSTETIVRNYYILTAGDLLEVSDLLVSTHSLTGSQVVVHEAFLHPGIVITSKAGWGQLTSFLARVQILELAKHLGTSRDEESRMGGEDFAWKLRIVFLIYTRSSSMTVIMYRIRIDTRSNLYYVKTYIVLIIDQI